jgi:isoamylase
MAKGSVRDDSALMTSIDASSRPFKVWRGYPSPLGATVHPHGVNFALYSENAERVELCLFGPDARELLRVEMAEQTNKVWHVFLHGAKPGLQYGYRVYGPYRPSEGHRFNPHKLLLDPYAKAISGRVQWNPAVFGYVLGHPDGDLSFDTRDSAAFVPKGIVIDSHFDWGDDDPPRTPWHESVIYELHVKGFTKLHPVVPKELRGTYAGLAHPAAIDHLKRLGVTAVELLPVHQFIEDDFLQRKGLHNYWGYSTIGYFAPEWRYSNSGRHGGQVQEFKSMVKALHEAGLEVILDVVYNHTAEGNQLGPTLSFRGIDNESYYRLLADDPRYYMDYTGTGNTLNVVNLHALRLIMDSLRYWVQEMRVDGFRFDLASALARGFHEVNQLHAFFGIILQDPVLSGVKLIAEPWDLGEGGYQVGQFPDHWAEWNDKFRDTVRAFWKGEEGLIGDLAYRLTGSSDLYARTGRRPFASINFVTAHDGFTLEDLVSYDRKHNEENLEDNRDGSDNNLSWNCGAEGATTDTDILNLRARQKRNLLATLFLSQGVPMLTAGDELGRTQRGNNNAYCQDNEISWIDWERADPTLIEFTRKLIAIRFEHRVFHRRNFFQGKSLRGSGAKDIFWFMPNGKEMTDVEWDKDFARCLGIHFSGADLAERNKQNQLIKDDDFIWLLNASDEAIRFHLPSLVLEKKWKLVFDSSDDQIGSDRLENLEHGYVIGPRACALMMDESIQGP